MDDAAPPLARSAQSTSAPQSIEDAVARARSLASAIRARAEETEQSRQVPLATLNELRQAGLLDLVTPRMFGGAELGMAALTAVGAEIAAACGSAGWVYSVFVGHNWMVALFPEAAQREVFGDPVNAVASVVHFGGKQPTRVQGGYRFKDGVGRLCSGVDHATWILLGTAVTGEGGPPEPRYFLVPRSEFEIVDDWHVAGLRGTGSKSVRLADAFVPEYRSVSIPELAKGNAPGLALHASVTYRAPFPEVLILALAGAPIGIAQGALARYCDALRVQYADLGDEQVAEQSTAFVRLTQASADIDAAAAIIQSAAARIDACADPSQFDRTQRARFLRDYAYAAQTARRAVNSLFEGGGSRPVYDSSELQRSWRDMNTACAHAGFSWERTVPTFARAMLNLPPGKFEARRGH